MKGVNFFAETGKVSVEGHENKGSPPLSGG